MKKVKLFEQFLLEETSFPAQFEIGEPVSFITSPGEDERWGSVVKVSFTKAKVFYDILDDYTSTVIDNIDSSFVKTLRSDIKLEEPTNEAKEQPYVVLFWTGDDDWDWDVMATSTEDAIDKVKSGKAKGPHGESLPRTARNFTAKAKQK